MTLVVPRELPEWGDHNMVGIRHPLCFFSCHWLKCVRSCFMPAARYCNISRCPPLTMQSVEVLFGYLIDTRGRCECRCLSIAPSVVSLTRRTATRVQGRNVLLFFCRLNKIARRRGHRCTCWGQICQSTISLSVNQQATTMSSFPGHFSCAFFTSFISFVKGTRVG